MIAALTAAPRTVLPAASGTAVSAPAALAAAPISPPMTARRVVSMAAHSSKRTSGRRPRSYNDASPEVQPRPMDNLTHSLIGLIAGDCVARTLPHSGRGISPSQRRSILLVLFIAGGNLPDLDLILTSHLFSVDPLRYVIQHRGYTHTIVGCCVLALCLYACVEFWARRRGVAFSVRDRALFGSMALSGTLLHLGMDFLNSYGVHPFWPWYNGWVYGDSVFIIEPLYWVATAPLIATVQSRVTRALLILTVLVGLGVA